MIRKKKNGDLSVGIAGNQENLSSQNFVDFLRENGGAGKIANDVLKKLGINTKGLSTASTELITDNTEEAKKTYFED